MLVQQFEESIQSDRLIGNAIQDNSPVSTGRFAKVKSVCNPIMEVGRKRKERSGNLVNILSESEPAKKNGKRQIEYVLLCKSPFLPSSHPRGGRL
jgi:hypothetical protein